MSHSLLGAAAPSFDEPLEMLDACHGRIQAQIETLRRLVQHLPRHGADQAAREAAQGVLRYFSVAAPHHHADEENDLFPALLASRAVAKEPAVAAQVEALIERILADHRLMDRARDEVLARLQSIVAAQPGECGEALPAAMVEGLAELYLGHIDLETRELLPLGRRLLSPEQAAAVGRSMAARRGAVFPEGEK